MKSIREQIDYLEGGERYLEAKALIEKVLSEEPTDAEMWCKYGFVLNELEAWNAATKAFKRAVELRPDSYIANAQLGISYLMVNNFPEAQRYCESSLKIKETAQGNIYLGEVFTAQDKIDQATQCYQKAIRLDPNFEEAHFNLASLLVATKDASKIEEAEKHLLKAVALSPQYQDAFIELGKIYHQQNKYSDAEKSFKKAIEIDPQSNVWSYIYLANLLSLLNRVEESESFYSQAINLFPTSGLPRWSLGRHYLSKGQLALAKKNFEDSLELESNHESVYFDLGSLYLRMGDLDLAKSVIEKGLRAFPESVRLKKILKYKK